MTVDPTRLNDPASGATAALRELLRSTVNDGPSPDQLQRLAARFGPQLGGAPSAPTSPAVRAVGISAGKLAAVVAVAVVVAGGGGFLIGRATAPDRPADATPIAAHAPLPVDRSPEPPPPSTDLRNTSAPTSSPPTSSSHRETPPPEPRRSRGAATPHVESTQQVDTAEMPRPLATDDEISILSNAQRALVAGDARGALALTDTSAAQFPQGTFVEEREALAIEALVALNRLDEARTRFDAFRARYPRSTYRERLQRLVVIAPE